MKASKKKKILKLDENQKYQIVETEDKSLNKDLKIFSMGLASEIGFSIAIPLVVGALAGVWLDEKFASRPKLTLSFLFIAVIISFINLIKIANDIIKKR